MDTAEIIWLSAKVAATAVAAALPFAFAAAWLIARTSMPGRSLLQAAVMLPLVLPPVVTGYLLLSWFGKNGFVGQFLNSLFGLSFSFNWLGAALAAGAAAGVGAHALATGVHQIRQRRRERELPVLGGPGEPPTTPGGPAAPGKEGPNG